MRTPKAGFERLDAPQADCVVADAARALSLILNSAIGVTSMYPGANYLAEGMVVPDSFKLRLGKLDSPRRHGLHARGVCSSVAHPFLYLGERIIRI